MFHDIFMNITILISFLLVIGQTFKNNAFESKESLKTQILLGIVFGTLGMLLMLFTIRMTDSVIVDLRYVSVMCAGILGGPLAAVFSTLIIALFRIVNFGINTTSLTAFIICLIVGSGIAYISQIKQSRRNRFIYMFVLAMLVPNIGLLYLLRNNNSLQQTLVYYWPVYLLVTVFAYFSCEYIVSVNSNYRTMSYYKITAENLTDIISTIEPGGRILFVSAPILPLCGYTPEEYIGTSAYDYIHPEDIKAIKNEFSKSIRLKTASTLILRMRHKNGRYIWVETALKTVRNIDGSIKEMICVTRDISYRKEIEQELRISNARLKAVFDNAGTGIVVRDCYGSVVDANAAYLNMIGFSKEEVISLKNIIYPDDYDKANEIHRNLVNGKYELDRSEIRYLNKNNDVIYADTASTLIRGNEFTPTSIISIVNNITEKKEIEKKLKESEERFRTAFDNAVIGMSLSDLDGKFLKVNQALCELTGYTEEELLNTNFSHITHPDDLEREGLLTKQLLAGDVPNYSIEKRYIHKNGNIIWVLVGIAIINDIEGNFHHFIGQVQDITDRKLAEEELKKANFISEKLASTDYLTGIFNRRAFQNRLSQEFNRAYREDSSISLILVDIDYFKKVNDIYGHQAGDIALQEFVKCLSNVCRPYDFLGRHGGEEFIICLPNTGEEQAVKIAERMRIAVEELNIYIENREEAIKITASFGVASPILSNEENIDSLILQADRAMYKAKASGRNKICTL